MNELGISFTKEEIKDTISKPVKAAQIDEIDDNDNDEEDYDGNLVGDIQCNSTTESENEDFVTDIPTMEQFGTIDKGECGKIKNRFKCTEKRTIAMYTKFEHNQLQRQKNHSKIIPFVEVEKLVLPVRQQQCGCFKSVKEFPQIAYLG